MIDAEKAGISPNINCLEGKRCPACGSFGPFEVVVSMRVLLSDDGTDYGRDGSAEFGDDALAMFLSCQHEGQFGEFDE